MSISYKKIDTIPKLLEKLWSIFPNIIAIDKNTRDPAIGVKLVNDALIIPAIQNSTEFCQLVQNGTISVKAFAKGGFGQVGDITINEDELNQPLQAIIISIKRYGGFEPFYVPVIMKLYFNQESPKWYISPITSLSDSSGLHNALFISDPLSEMVFGSMLGHLYDTGICPFFTKYFGAYVCNESNQTSIITEKASFELKRLISRNTNTPVLTIKPIAILNILFQYVYALYIMKSYYGMTHFDTQHRNIMVTYIHDRIFKFNGSVPVTYVYQGENISKKKLILFQTSKIVDGLPVYICIQNTGLLLKLIDYGVCVAHLDRSLVEKYRVNMTISSIHADLQKINADKAYENTVKHANAFPADTFAYSNTVDLQYTLNNVYEHVLKGLDTHVYQRQPDPKAPVENAEIIKLLNIFTQRFFGTSIEDHLTRHPEQRIQLNPKGKLSWVSYTHDAGLTDSKWVSPLQLLEGLIDVCDKSKHVTFNFKKIKYNKAYVTYFEPDVETMLAMELNDKNTMLLNTSGSDYQHNMNQFLKWMDTSNQYNSKCKNNMVSLECRNLKTEELKHSLTSTIGKKLMSPTPPTFSLNSPKNLIKRNNLFEYYQYQFNPKAVKTDRNLSGGLAYQTFQSWLDFNFVPESKAGLYIETIYLHVFKIKTVRSIELKKGVDLWNGALTTLVGENGLSINGGYFIVKGNINYLYPKLNESSVLKPIGYSYIAGHSENGTILPFPDVYDEDLGVVYGFKQGPIKLESWTTFRDKHTLIDDVVRYESIDGKVIEQPIKSISMDSGVLVGKVPTESQLSYDFAFVTGPILISGNKVVFTNEKMNNQIMTVNNQLVHAVPGAQNSYKYRAAAGEGNQYYGMRHSHRYMVHNVLGIDGEGNYYIFLCEGRGFDAPGLDRVQLSYLIQRFGIHSAIALDGGFSANAVFKDCDVSGCKPVFTLNDPEKRKLGISMYLS